MKTRKWANRLGWFGIGLGIFELVAAERIADAIGLGSTTLIRVFGVREIASGIGILAADEKGPWIWGRIVGDALDGAVLGAAIFGNQGRRKRNAALALATVSPVVAMDVVCGRELGLSA